MVGEGVEGAGDGVEGNSAIDLGFFFFSALLEDALFAGAAGEDVWALGDVSAGTEPTCGGRPDGLCFEVDVELAIGSRLEGVGELETDAVWD